MGKQCLMGDTRWVIPDGRRSKRYLLHAVGGVYAVFATGKNREKLWAKIASFTGRFSLYVTIKYNCLYF